MTDEERAALIEAMRLIPKRIDRLLRQSEDLLEATRQLATIVRLINSLVEDGEDAEA